LSRPNWLLRFYVGGKSYSFASYAASVESLAYGSIPFSSGLMTSVLGPTMQTSVRVVGLVDWNKLAQDAGGITGGKATLKRVSPGKDWDTALAIIPDGIIKSARYEGLELVLTISAYRPVGPVISSQQVIDSTTHPTAPDDRVIGQYYPRIYGYPGFRAIGVPRPVVPCMFVHDDLPAGRRFLFSGHQTQVYRNGGDVQLWRTSGTPGTASAPVLSRLDALGQRYNYVTGLPISTVSVGDSLYVGFDLTEGGGLLNEDSGQCIRGAGDVLLDLMRLSGMRVDIAAMKKQSIFLNAYKLDFYINNGKAGAEEALSALVDVLPVTEETTSRGVYYQVWNWRASRKDVVASIDIQRDGWSLEGSVEEIEFTPYNHFTLEFAVDKLADAPLERRMITARLDPLDSRVSADWRCAASLDKYGEVYYLPPISSSVLWDVPTANLMLADLTAEHSLPRPVYRYRAPMDDLKGDRLKGAVVSISDSDRHYADRLALLWPVSYDDIRTTVEVHLLPQVPS